MKEMLKMRVAKSENNINTNLIVKRMMQLKIYLSLLFISILISCQQEIYIPNNYLKAEINGKSFIVYQDNRLNNDTVPNTFSFSFGKSTTNNANPSLFLSVSLNRQNFYISFPMPTEKTTYIVYRNSNIVGQPSAFYSIVPSNSDNDGLEIFYTQNIQDIAEIEGQAVGEIMIDKINTNSRIVEGRFNFSAYGYEVSSTETFIATNNTVGISNGEFYFHWE